MAMTFDSNTRQGYSSATVVYATGRQIPSGCRGVRQLTEETPNLPQSPSSYIASPSPSIYLSFSGKLISLYSEMGVDPGIPTFDGEGVWFDADTLFEIPGSSPA